MSLLNFIGYYRVLLIKILDTKHVQKWQWTQSLNVCTDNTEMGSAEILK